MRPPSARAAPSRALGYARVMWRGRLVLVFASPAGFEHFAMELGEPAVSDDRPPDLAIPGPDVLGPVAERYGIEVVGPPMRH